jgi:hypothetical protein
MVFVCKVGNIECHEPPYTKEEEAAFYGAHAQPWTVAADRNIAAPPPPAAPAAKRKAPRSK